MWAAGKEHNEESEKEEGKDGKRNSVPKARLAYKIAVGAISMAFV
jgi:hypothetical protein